VDSNSERRTHRRFVYETDISHDLLAHDHIYKAKLFNFGKDGLYFESNQSIFPGEEVFIKFEDQQDSSQDDIMSQLPFGVEIVWQKENMLYKNLEAEKDPRQYPRRQYHKSLHLSYKDKNYRGEFENISKGGVFIKTDIKFTAGKQIRVVIPGSKIRKKMDLKGLIVRINTQGFGVKFDRKSDLEDGRN